MKNRQALLVSVVVLALGLASSVRADPDEPTGGGTIKPKLGGKSITTSVKP
jgi:hypothetical protein